MSKLRIPDVSPDRLNRLDSMFTVAKSVVIDGHALMQGDVRDAMTKQHIDHANLNSRLQDVGKWLPVAAEKYQVSSNLADMALVPVGILTSEIPNRNGVGFTFEELASFNTEQGRIAYRTWIGKGTYMEHEKNRVPEVAKGVILDVALRKMPQFEGSFYLLNHLLAFDRNKDPDLANAIIERKRTGYSMGSLCQHYNCSICHRNVNDIGGICEHINVSTALDRARSMRPMPDGKLAFSIPMEITGIECSSVSVPAYSKAVNPNYLE
jgi:hypothetical protein